MHSDLDLDTALAMLMGSALYHRLLTAPAEPRGRRLSAATLAARVVDAFMRAFARA